MSQGKRADAGRAREDDREEQLEERIERQPMGGYTQNLKVAGIPEHMVPRWINHKGERIREALAAGYQPVFKDKSIGDVRVSGGDDSDMDQWISKPVGGTEGGRPLHAYLMVIRKEWYDEDQAKKQALIDETDKAIRANPFQGNPDENTFVKQADIQTNVPLRR